MVFSFSRLFTAVILVLLSIVLGLFTYFLFGKFSREKLDLLEQQVKVRELVNTSKSQQSPSDFVDQLVAQLPKEVVVDYFNLAGKIVATSMPENLGKIITEDSDLDQPVAAKNGQDSSVLVWLDNYSAGIRVSLQQESTNSWVFILGGTAVGLGLLVLVFYLVTYSWLQNVNSYFGRETKPCRLLKFFLKPLQLIIGVRKTKPARLDFSTVKAEEEDDQKGPL